MYDKNCPYCGSRTKWIDEGIRQCLNDNDFCGVFIEEEDLDPSLGVKILTTTLMAVMINNLNCLL
ncbi:hypothetical protein CV093_06010 [Oceanobacillus sp. 143]|nr:hypothetical protein CV093_06010 [Oceanobacillus sp. 143]